MLDDENSGKKYQQIRDEIAQAIRAGRYAPKQKLPSETQLASKFSASRGTVLRALLDLTHAGLIERRRGSGTFVRAAAGPSGGKFGLIARDLFETQQSGVLGTLVRKIAEAAGSRGYSLLHHALPENVVSCQEKLWEAADEIISHRSTGAFFLPFPLLSEKVEDVNRQIVERLAKAGLPIVLLDSDIVDHPGRSNFDVVTANNRQGGAALTEHLLEQGCRRIGFISNVQGVSTISERIAGYSQVLLKHGVRTNQNWVVFEPQLSPSAIKKLMSRFDFDGLLFKDDGLAAQGCKFLSALGYRVGTDVKVAGFDDAPIAQLLNVPLTTVRQPVNDMALNAINLMLDRISNSNGNSNARTLMTNCELIIRESTQSAKGGKG